MFKTIILPTVLLLFFSLFLLVSIGEKQFNNKVLYAAIAGILLVMLLSLAKMS